MIEMTAKSVFERHITQCEELRSHIKRVMDEMSEDVLDLYNNDNNHLLTYNFLLMEYEPKVLAIFDVIKSKAKEQLDKY